MDIQHLIESIIGTAFGASVAYGAIKAKLAVHGARIHANSEQIKEVQADTVRAHGRIDNLLQSQGVGR